MAHLEATPTELVIRLEGLRRAFGRWRPMVIPWAHIKQAHLDARIARSFPGARWGVSTYVPGVLALGSFRRGGRRVFLDVRDPEKAVVIELTGEKYDRLVLEVDDPEAALAMISGAGQPA